MTRNPYALTFGQRVALAWRIATTRLSIDATLRDFLGEDSQGKPTSRASWASTYEATKDRPWYQRHENLTDALAAWRTNPLARRMVNLTRDHVWGNGIRPRSRINAVQKWLDRFWFHELNNMVERLPVWIDAWTTDGEVFPTFHQNEVDGMVFVRALSAVQVEGLKWLSNDYEQLTAIGQRAPGQIELVWWPTLLTAAPGQSFAGQFAINVPLGATRGDGDLASALPWLAFYSDWLEARVERNAALSHYYVEVTVQDQKDVPDAQARYARPPADGSMVVHSAAEKHEVIQPKIGADDAQADGFALKSMVAVGGNIPVFWLGDVGQGNTEATSENMTDTSYRHYETRQGYVRKRIEETCRIAYTLAAAQGAVRRYNDPGISTDVADVRRSDNQALAQAARDIAEALAKVVEAGLDQDERTLKLILKFAGEDLGDAEIKQIVADAKARAEKKTVAVPRTEGNTDDE